MDPFVFIIHNKIKPGKIDDFREHYRNSIPRMEVDKPRTLVQLAYENQDATEVTIVRFFHETDGLDAQLHGASKRSKTTYEFIEPVGIEIFGAPSASALAMMEKIAGSGIPITVHPEYIGGFIR